MTRLRVRASAAAIASAGLIVSMTVAAPSAALAAPSPAAAVTPPAPARVAAAGAEAAFATPGLALPAWSDTQWGAPEYGTTIHTGDLDGDGLADLAGRGPYGLEANSFDGDLGQWLPIPAGPGPWPFSDADGWEAEQYYATIRIADVDGDGRAEALSRGPKGFEVWSLDTSRNAWAKEGAPAAFTGAFWDEARYFTTIETADLDGDGDAEVLGRGRDGVEAWDFYAATETWVPLTLLRALSDDNGFKPIPYSSTFQTADVDGDGRDEILCRSKTGVVVYGLAADGSSWPQEPSLAQFIDADPWDLPSSYETIQTADLDGDGRAEVFGRDKHGIVAYGTDAPSGWEPLRALTGDFGDTDPDHWASSAAYYATIRAADIDGDGQAEILGRGVHGMHVWALTNSGQKWQPWADAGPFADDLGWSRALAYPSIQTANIDGFTPLQKSGKLTEPRAELLGRGPTGVQTYRWDPQARTWVSPTAVFADWDQPSAGAYHNAYDYVNTTLGGSLNPDFDLRALYPTADSTQLDSWKSAIAAMTPPPGMPTAPFTAVTSELIDEVEAVKQVAGWYATVGANVHTLYEGRSMDPTRELLSYDKNRSTKLEGSVFDAFGGMIHALASTLGPQGNGMGAAIASLISAGVAFATTAELNSFEKAYLDVDGLLEQAFQDALDGVQAAKRAAVTDLGLLRAVAELVDSAVWEPTPADGTALAAALRQYSVWVWQLLTPHMWEVGAWSDSRMYWDTRGGWSLVHKDIFHFDVGKKIRDQLFERTDAGCRAAWDPATCNLHVPKESVFRSLDGWKIACFTGRNTLIACPPGPEASSSP
ncbi:VCBS repeat-containing protein [Microbacter sp. GSS18]|nr:VCBS repeat-containing protein [Microbacter sp. GSS18]